MFITQKNGNRVYKVGSRLIQIPRNVLTVFRSWATHPFEKNEKYDEKIVKSLLILIIGTGSISENNIDQNVKDFVKGIFFIVGFI